MLRMFLVRGAWLAQWVQHVTLDLWVVSSSPTLVWSLLKIKILTYTKKNIPCSIIPESLCVDDYQMKNV